MVFSGGPSPYFTLISSWTSLFGLRDRQYIRRRVSLCKIYQMGLVRAPVAPHVFRSFYLFSLPLFRESVFFLSSWKPLSLLCLLYVLVLLLFWLSLVSPIAVKLTHKYDDCFYATFVLQERVNRRVVCRPCPGCCVKYIVCIQPIPSKLQRK